MNFLVFNNSYKKILFVTIILLPITVVDYWWYIAPVQHKLTIVRQKWFCLCQQLSHQYDAILQLRKNIKDVELAQSARICSKNKAKPIAELFRNHHLTQHNFFMVNENHEHYLLLGTLENFLTLWRQIQISKGYSLPDFLLLKENVSHFLLFIHVAIL